MYLLLDQEDKILLMIIKKTIMSNKEYFNNNQLIYNVWKSKYQFGDETPDDTIKRIVDTISNVDYGFSALYSRREEYHKLSEYGQKVFEYLSDNTKENSFKMFYQLLKDYGKLIPGGSILTTLGTNKKSTLSNCYVTPSPEDKISSIFDSVKTNAVIYSNRGGCGTDMSNLRPRGAKVNNAASSSTGAVSFMELYSINAQTIGADGRRAAQMLTMSDRHPDIEEFIKIKSDLSKIPGANLSIMMSKALLDSSLEDKDWTLCFPVNDENLIKFDSKPEYDSLPYNELIQVDENKYIKKIKARKLFDMIVHYAHKTAEPGILLKDNLLEYDPTSVYDDLRFVSTNPCGGRSPHVKNPSISVKPFN